MVQVTDTELFCLLKEKHGKGGFELFVEEKIVPLAGDVIFENMGLDAPRLEELAKEVDIIVNGAATTNFYERSPPKFIYNSAFKNRNKVSFLVTRRINLQI